MQSDNQIERIIQRALLESFSDYEKLLFDGFLIENTKANPANWTTVDADNFVSRLDGADVSNEFLANAITRLAQLAPSHIISRILQSDNDGDGVPLYEELKLGTKATEYNTSTEIAAARSRQYQIIPNSNNMEL